LAIHLSNEDGDGWTTIAVTATPTKAFIAADPA
jgi:hypothetical protein